MPTNTEKTLAEIARKERETLNEFDQSMRDAQQQPDPENNWAGQPSAAGVKPDQRPPGRNGAGDNVGQMKSTPTNETQQNYLKKHPGIQKAEEQIKQAQQDFQKGTQNNDLE